MKSPQCQINCSVFLETDAVIRNILVKIQKAAVAEKRYYVQDILLEIKTLLACLDYNPRHTDCLYCRRTLRKYLWEYKISFPCARLFLYSQEAERGHRFWMNRRLERNVCLRKKTVYR